MLVSYFYESQKVEKEVVDISTPGVNGLIRIFGALVSTGFLLNVSRSLEFLNFSYKAFSESLFLAPT